ncbi:MAG: hypothetical protein Q7L07_12885 [Pseudohongiella sp.]|nr:hypothetical protein [Pseudohongiella sp.]
MAEEANNNFGMAAASGPAETLSNPIDAPVAATPAHAPHGVAASDESKLNPEPVATASQVKMPDMVAGNDTYRQEPTATPERFSSLPFTLARAKDGKPFALFNYPLSNAVAMLIGGDQFEGYFVNLMYDQNGQVNLPQIREAIQQMSIFATHRGPIIDVWHRCAKIEDGCEIALSDEHDTRIRVTANGVKVIDQGSPTVFQKRPIALPLPRPSDTPNWERLKRYINLPEVQFYLLLAWLTYTLCSPKTKGTKYVFLVIQGDQGTGKSLLCRLIQSLIDPSALELQAFPANSRDLPVILNGSHLTLFDNVRSFNASMSDLLCTASTGGNISGRALYTNDGLFIQSLHGGIVFNGIHGFVVQSDLAQRCLTLRTKSIDGSARVNEAELLKDFEHDLPDIFAGLLDLASKIMVMLPDAIVSFPERMLEFCQWVAAMELAIGFPEGTVQAVYTHILNETQLDTLLDNSLASAVIKFVSDQPTNKWIGTPALLLEQLQDNQPSRGLYAKDWPQNPIQLSKRLNALKASLETQGIYVEISRGKLRRIEITNVSGLNISEDF